MFPSCPFLWRVINIDSPAGTSVFFQVSLQKIHIHTTAEGTHKLLNVQRETSSLFCVQLYPIKHPDVAEWNTCTRHPIQIQVEHINCANVLLRERETGKVIKSPQKRQRGNQLLSRPPFCCVCVRVSLCLQWVFDVQLNVSQNLLH